MSSTTWGRHFDPDLLAGLETSMWQAYYRRQPARLFALLVRANRAQARASWPRAVAAAALLARGASRFGRTPGTAAGDDPRTRRDVERGYRLLGLPAHVDVAEVARRELRWWVVRREIGLEAGAAAGEAIAALWAALYELPLVAVAEAGRLRGQAAEVRDRGATADPDGPAGRGQAYWPEVAALLRASYVELARVVGAPVPATAGAPAAVARASNQYAFLTRWELPATTDEIADILGNAADLARWWPSVYLRVTVLEPGDERGVGRVVDLYTKGWLPYTLRWRFRVTEIDTPGRFALEATGDFAGRGVWTLTRLPDAPDGTPRTAAEYDWRISAEKGILRRLSFLLKPVFAANHHWAMARGETSIRIELARRHAAGDAAVLAALPSPPKPTFPWLVRAR